MKKIDYDTITHTYHIIEILFFRCKEKIFLIWI